MITTIDKFTFDIYKPYFFFDETNQEKNYDIYCDSSLTQVNKQIFSFVCGFIVCRKTSAISGIFYYPLHSQKSKDVFLVPDFLDKSVFLALKIKNFYKNFNFNIYSDNSLDLKNYKQFVKTISSEDNVSSKIVSHIKQTWLKIIFSKTEDTLYFQQFFNSNHEYKDIFVNINPANVNEKAYYVAFDKNKNIIDHIDFKSSQEHGAFEIIYQLLLKDIDNVNFILSKKMFDKFFEYSKNVHFQNLSISIFDKILNILKNKKYNINFSTSEDLIYISKIEVNQYLITLSEPLRQQQIEKEKEIKRKYEESIYISSKPISFRKKIYFFAYHNDKKVFDYISFEESNPYGSFDLILKIFDSNKAKNITFIITNKLFNKIKTYADLKASSQNHHKVDTYDRVLENLGKSNITIISTQKNITFNQNHVYNFFNKF